MIMSTASMAIIHLVMMGKMGSCNIVMPITTLLA